MSKEILWYDLVPHYKPDPKEQGFGFANAAMLQCMMTGKYLASSGGGGPALSVEAVEAIDARRYGAKPKAVIEIDDLKMLLDHIEKHPVIGTQSVQHLVASLRDQLNL